MSTVVRAGKAVYGIQFNAQLEGASVHRLGAMELLQVVGPPPEILPTVVLGVRVFNNKASCHGTGCPGFVPLMGTKVGL